MKRVALLLALLLPLVSGCDMKGIDQDLLLEARQDKPVGEKVILSAYVADGATDTKTSYNWSTNKILWNPGDKISLFYGSGTNGGERFTSTLTESSNKSDFSGTISIVSGVMEDSEEKQFWGIYPYSQQNEAAGSYVTVTVQHEQTAVAETFAPGHFVSIGRSPGLSMGFYNLCGAFYVKFTRDDIVSVKFRGKGGQPVAGRVKVGMNSSGKPEVQEFVEQQTEVTLSLPGGYAFTPGVGYYIVSLPAVFSDGFEFEMTTAAGYKGTKSFNINYTLARNDFQGFSKTIDNGVEFTKEGNIEFADANVKAICVAPERGWDTDGDGELSYTEAAAVTTIPYGLFSNNTTITSFDEFQYFTGVTSLGYRTENDEGTTYYGAFYNCTALQSIILPSSLTDISYGAFRDCNNLEAITIPATVTSIGEIAFLGCTKLEVTMESETPCTLYKDGTGTYDAPYSFGFLTSGRVKAILVPTDESVTAYREAWGYSTLIHKVGWVDPAQLITFQDPIVELYCVENWDTNGDEKLSMSEAAAVTTIGTTFKGIDISSFDELKYFTSISTIPYNAFSGCKLLESISFPPQITAIGSSAFTGTSKLKKISVPSLDLWLDVVCSVKPFDASRSGNLYLNGNLVTELTVPNRMTSIPDYMCYCLKELETVIIPNCVTSIGNYAFYNCTGLTSISIPEGVTTIGDYAFSGCSSLPAMTIPEGVTSIKKYAFAGLTIGSMPESLITISEGAFRGCSFISPSICLPNVTGVGLYSFASSGITAVSLPAIKSIGDYAFKDCANLESVDIPEIIVNTSFATIGIGAFQNCTALHSFIFPRNKNKIEISESTFEGCTSLQSITIPGGEGGVYSIGKKAFYGCSLLNGISVPNIDSGSGSIGEYAFSGCSGLETVDIGEGVTTIGQYAFSGVNAKTVRLPSTISKLNTDGQVVESEQYSYNFWHSYGAFLGSSIESIEVYSQTLGDVFLKGFQHIKYRRSNGYTEYSTTSDAPKIIVVRKSQSTYALPNNAFNGLAKVLNSRLESITLPNGLTSIGSCAFQNLATLTSLTLPSTLKSIAYSAFSGCTGLLSIRVNPTTPPTGGGGMFDNTGSCPIYVPAESVDTYKAADIWSTYASRIQAIPE